MNGFRLMRPEFSVTRPGDVDERYVLGWLEVSWHNLYVPLWVARVLGVL